MNPRASIDASTWTKRYEAVREHRLTGRQTLGTDPLGLVLLIKHGVAGWMRRWLDGLAPERPVPEMVARLHPPTPLWQQQLTILLAHMTVNQLGPLSAS